MARSKQGFFRKVSPQYAAVGAVVLLAVVLYLLVLPSVLANGYKHKAEPAHKAIQEKMASVYKTFDAGAYSVNREKGLGSFDDEQAGRSAFDNLYNANKAELANWACTLHRRCKGN